MTDLSKARLYALDPVAFAVDMLGFTPDAVQAEVLRCVDSYGIINCSRQWGKSTVTAVKAVHLAYFRAESLILVVSASERQSAIFLDKARALVRKLDLPARGDGLFSHSLKLPNGSRIVALPSTDDRIRGFSAPSLVVLDEASRIGEEIFDAVMPMLATGDGLVWQLSTPNGKQGFFYKTWTSGGDVWRRFSVKATECPRMSGRFLAWQRETMADSIFRQEYLCEFTEPMDGLLPGDCVRASLSNDVRPLF